eukprot:317433-Amphidinium_carterae.1
MFGFEAELSPSIAAITARAPLNRCCCRIDCASTKPKGSLSWAVRAIGLLPINVNLLTHDLPVKKSFMSVALQDLEPMTSSSNGWLHTCLGLSGCREACAGPHCGNRSRCV